MTLTPPRRALPSRHYESGAIVAEKYELERLLGEGGMGSVWLAQNRLLEVPVALKLLRADFDAVDAADRLLREARAAARIGHRAIVRVFDFGHTDCGDPFIVMELLEGQNLAELLAERGPLDPIEAVQLLLPVVDALAVAHDAGIVHRDLKPANVFLVTEQRRTQPKIVDFGIAKMNQSSSEAPRSLTRHGEVVGSPGYMSPEQARGLSRISGRTDVWAVCVVLYECVTGRPPFVGDNYHALLRSIIEDAAQPTIDLGKGDQALWQLLERGLRKEPEERWGSMRELGAELAYWLLDRGVEQDVCGDPLEQFLDSPEEKPASRGVRGRHRLVSVHAGAAPSAITIQARESSSRPRASQSDDETSFRESASPLTQTRRPEVPLAMSRKVIALVTLAVLAAVAATVGSFSAGRERSADRLGEHPARAAAGSPRPATSFPSLGVAGSAQLEVRAPESPLPPPVAVEPVEDKPHETVLAPSSPASSSRREPHLRIAEKPPSARPSASAPPAPAPAVPAGNPDLKDPY